MEGEIDIYSLWYCISFGKLEALAATAAFPIAIVAAMALRIDD